MSVAWLWSSSTPLFTRGGAEARRSLDSKLPFRPEEEDVAKKARPRHRWQSAMLTLLRHCGRNLLTFKTVRAVNKSDYTTQMGKRVAVVLAGCGVYDGSEIHEASALLVHLSRGGASVSSLVCWYAMYEPLGDMSGLIVKALPSWSPWKLSPAFCWCPPTHH